MDKEPNYWTKEEQVLFEKYLFGQMDDTTEAAFENKLTADPRFKTKFLEFKRAVRAVEEEGMRKKVETFHQGMGVEPKVRQLRNTANRAFYRIAAAVLFFAVLGGLWFYYLPDSNERLFSRYFSPDPGLPTPMGNEENYAFYEAMVTYKTGDYTTAIQKWETLQAQTPKNDTLTYFIAMAHLANGEGALAASLLEQNLKEDKPPFPEETHYYLGMASLKLGQIDAARLQLQKSGLPDAQLVLQSLE